MPPRQRSRVAKAAAEKWWAVVDTDGRLVSVGTVLADPLGEGLIAVGVDGPGTGKVWDPQARAWADPPPAVAPAPDPVQVTFTALTQVAADPAKSAEEKLAAFIAVLANAAPAPEESA